MFRPIFSTRQNKERTSNFQVVQGPLSVKTKKINQVIDIRTAAPSYPTTSLDRGYYRRIYFEAIDLIVNAIDLRFNQPGYVMYVAYATMQVFFFFFLKFLNLKSYNFLKRIMLMMKSLTR